jgi:L-fucose isomerase-like protein
MAKMLRVRYVLLNYEAEHPPFRMRFGKPQIPTYLWGDFRSKKDVEEEKVIVKEELNALKKQAEFELQIEGGDILTEEAEVFEHASELKQADVILVYGTTDFSNLLEAISALNRWTIVFIKVYKGKLYEQAEVVNPRFLRGETDKREVDRAIQVVFDDYEELLRILRAMQAIKRARESNCLCLGIPYGWQMRYREVRAAEQRIGFKVSYASYKEFKKLIDRAKANQAMKERATKLANQIFQGAKEVREPSRKDCFNACLAYLVMKELVEKRRANSLTVSDCFSTFWALTKTPACLPLTLFNDRGVVAGCEGDFAAFSAQLLLSYLANKPCFFLDPIVHPGSNKVILAHCTSPLLPNGYQTKKLPYILRSQDALHKGVAVKLIHPKGQVITLADPSFDLKRMIITKGEITRTTNYEICRNQFEVKVKDSKALFEHWIGFHWVACYGDYLSELEKACKLLGIECQCL